MNASDKLRSLLAGGMSQSDIARAVGVSQPTISRIISGQHDMKASTAARIDAVWSAVVASRAAA